jgi:hypothetical protein
MYKKAVTMATYEAEIQSPVNTVVDMYFILVLIFVNMSRCVHRKDTNFSSLPLLSKSATVTCVTIWPH